jgi:hypothetical protein
MIELLLPFGFDTIEYSWVKATIGICMLADYSVAMKRQHYAHFHVLQQMSIVFEYLDEHMEVLLRDIPGHSKSWLANEHMRKFTGWLRDRISQSSDTQASEYLKKLACGPIFIVVTYQGYDINGYTFYTK